MTAASRSVRTLVGLASGGVALAVGASAITAWTLATPSAHATAAEPEAKLIASVDVIYLIEAGLAKPALAAERATLGAAINARVEQIRQSITELETRASALNPQDPAFQTLYNQYAQKRQELEEVSAAGYRDSQRLAANQAGPIYQEIRDAIDAVALREGYRYVLSSKPDRSIGDDLANVGIVTQQVLSRPLVHGGQGNDLTEFVRNELGYPVPPPVEDPSQPTAQPADAPTDATETPDSDSPAEVPTDAAP